MAVFRAGLTLWQKVVASVGLVLLFGGFAALLYGEFGPSVGVAGLAAHGAGSGGALAMGLGLLGYVAIFTADIWRARPRGIEAWRQEARESGREFGAFALNAVCYGGTVLLALGALSAADSVPVASIAIIAACIAGFVLFRRYRKRRPRTYGRVRHVGLLLLMAALGAFGIIAGTTESGKAVADALTGPQTIVCTFSDFNEHRPSGRYQALQTTDLVVDLTDADGRIISVSIKEQDRDALLPLIEAGGVTRAVYYPRTQTLVAFEPFSTSRGSESAGAA